MKSKTVKSLILKATKGIKVKIFTNEISCEWGNECNHES